MRWNILQQREARARPVPKIVEQRAQAETLLLCSSRASRRDRALIDRRPRRAVISGEDHRRILIAHVLGGKWLTRFRIAHSDQEIEQVAMTRVVQSLRRMEMIVTTGEPSLLNAKVKDASDFAEPSKICGPPGDRCRHARPHRRESIDVH
jgi:hypothetical protein